MTIDRRKLKRACVVGGFRKMFPPGFEPGWHLADRASTDYVHVPSAAEAFFVLTRMVKHVVVGRVQRDARLTGVPVYLVNGGTSALKRAMVEWLEGKAPGGYRVGA